MSSLHRRLALLSFAVLAPLYAAAEQPAAAQPAIEQPYFEVSTAGSSTRLKAGEKGVFVLSVRTREGAHVSNEAPLKLVLQSSGLKPAKSQLGRQDSVARAQPDKPHADPRFEVPFTAARAGKATLDAKLTFFLCREELCERQERSLSLPVEVL
jgi:hypothetical protein